MCVVLRFFFASNREEMVGLLQLLDVSTRTRTHRNDKRV